MKLRIEFIDDNTGDRVIIKNKKDRVFYYNSGMHDSDEYEEISGRLMKLDPNIQEVINTFYKLAGKLL